MDLQLPNWNKQFPFGVKYLKRAVNGLEKDGYLITTNYNKAGFDRTNGIALITVN